MTLRATNLTRYSYHSAMTSFDFLDFNADFTSPRFVNAYDELPLWSAMFGLLLFEEVPLTNIRKALDVGCGTGFPLIELAERLGPASEVHGIDPWSAGLERARQKLEVRATPNVTLHEGSATSMPFDDGTFDLIVSNLGVNNFDDRSGAMRECRRVARKGGTIALTTNLQGHMRELYDALAEVLEDRSALEKHIAHRATIPAVRQLLEENGFEVTRVIEREGVMRFANATALFNHHFIKLGFLDAWKDVAGDDAKEAFRRLMERLNAELRLTIPMAYVEAVAV
jgi:ubiquinone/menaquinone biosynthesis C-methylase UbiE